MDRNQRLRVEPLPGQSPEEFERQRPSLEWLAEHQFDVCPCGAVRFTMEAARPCPVSMLHQWRAPAPGDPSP